MRELIFFFGLLIASPSWTPVVLVAGQVVDYPTGSNFIRHSFPAGSFPNSNAALVTTV